MAASAKPLNLCFFRCTSNKEIAAKYSGYIEHQKDEIGRAAHYENLRLPAELDYMQVPALSIEVRQ